jgi:hypothetical protein
VDRALRPNLAERFEALRLEHYEGTKATPRSTQAAVLVNPVAYDRQALKEPQRQALIAFWTAWLERLTRVRVLDPACGSGAFLVEAFDQLQDRYEDAIEHLVELTNQPSLFDPDRTILQQNLFGVDVNEEAVEICRLSIWIKTAKRGKVLADLNENIRVGYSVVADTAVDPRALTWAAAFPQVHAEGGFDLVMCGVASNMPGPQDGAGGGSTEVCTLTSAGLNTAANGLRICPGLLPPVLSAATPLAGPPA